VNNRGKFGWLFPNHPEEGFRTLFSADHAARATGRVIAAMERSITTFVCALPVVDVAFVILVIAYVKAS
jgi:hypothetical protein